MKMMKKIKANFGLLSVFLAMTVAVVSCDDNDFPVPDASTQAYFTYEIDTLTNEQTGVITFGVQFYNESLNATGYHWDFGNGEESTEENPYVIYEEYGQYRVTLTVDSEKDLHYNKLEHSTTLTLVIGAVPVPFLEDFSSEEDIPEQFTVWDLDGDGHTWFYQPDEEEYGPIVRSASWDSQDGALTPDNWLITPLLDASAVGEGESLKLRYHVGGTASGEEFRQENYGIFISSGELEVEDFEKIFDERFTEDTPNWTAFERVLDISEYKGEQIYIAIRHYDVTDMFQLFITDIEVFAE